MPRTREFDKETVIQQTMILFWRQGYDGTSIRDVIRETGVSSSSLYETFGDKRALYIQTLKRYCYQEHLGFEQQIAKNTDIRQLLADIFNVVHSQATGDPSGLFSINCAVELGTRDTEITDIIWDHYQAVWALFRSALERAQNDGQVSTVINPDETAHVILTMLYGYASVLRVKPDFASGQGILSSMYCLLDKTP